PMHPWLIGVPASVAAVAGVTAYGAMWPRAQLFGRTICRTNSPRKLAITFDDGPNPAITPKLLTLLEQHHARATFFLIGRFVRECPDFVKEIAARGHSIGNHTESHPNLFRLDAAKILAELRLCHHAIANVLGTPPKWFRPPFGLRNPWVGSEARQLKMSVVMWTVLPGDWRGKPADWLIPRMEPIAQRARKYSAAESRTSQKGTGDILCLHDGNHRQLNADRGPTLAALEYWLPRWRDLGLEFVTMDQAVSTPAA
ncbi:MAG: polysaccharide deacetylase family protein, partial [Candidatus Acidiferrum sp.]